MKNGKPHPCPAPEPGWWASLSEEVLTEGPFESREAAISEALCQDSYQEIEPEGWDWSKPYGDPANQALTGWRAGVYVGLYQQRHIDLSRWFDADDWIESLYDRMDNENGSDEDGDNHPLDELTPEDVKSLQESVRLAIWHWQHRRQKSLRCYYMDGNAEFVTVPHPEDGRPAPEHERSGRA